MDYDRLRELQAKFDENPRRYFAPLANEYRKGGNPKRAIEICRAHLAQMPGHMSGQVVYGQSLFEGGEYDEARKIFEAVLVLDPENLIALRSLGDLSLQGGNNAEARTWYTRLLDADPKDAAVVALVSEIDATDTTLSSESQSASELAIDFSFVDPPPALPSATESRAGESAPPEESDEPPIGLELHYPTGDSVPSPPEPIGPDRDSPAPPPPPPSEEAPASSFAGTNPEPFVNETMAQLYLQQGYRQLALRVYRQLSERKPEEQSLKDRIAEIEASQAAGGDRPEPQARREEPSSTESPLPHGPAGQPTPVEGPGFDPAPVDSPPPSSPSGEPDSIESPVRGDPRAEPEGIAARQPSMREFFATLGRRRPPRPAPAPASSWGRSESAAHSPAAAHTAKPGSLDAVFAGAKVSTTDARAASTLAGAFSASARGTSPPSSTATPTPRANPRLQSQESEEDVAKFRAWLDGLTGE